jgi:two-component system sensor histidine kinase/response regulator
MTESLDAIVYGLDDTMLPSTPFQEGASDVQRFVLVVSAPFSIALIGTPLPPPAGIGIADWNPSYATEIYLNPEAIAHHVRQFAARCGLIQIQGTSIDELCTHICPNDPVVQEQFLNLFVQQWAIAQSSAATVDTSIFPGNPERVASCQYPESVNLGDDSSLYPLVCRPVEAALQHQVAQERLLNQVVTQIRQSLELPVILKTATEQVRQFLGVDRLVIYQLRGQSYATSRRDWATTSTAAPQRTISDTVAYPTLLSGTASGTEDCMTYESKATADIVSLQTVTESCCAAQLRYYQKYPWSDRPLAITNVELAYADEAEMLAFLKHAGVQSKLVVPIFVHEQFWGLLVAHQCTYMRLWEPNEQEFLQQIAGHLAIAISQAQLYAQVQQQKDLLEKGVIERTRDLQEAMLVAQQASRAKTEFLAAMSHELRTPLTTIIGMSSTLMRWATNQLNERQQGYLQTIYDSGKHLLELINDILDLSRVETGQLNLKFNQFSIANLAQQSLKLWEEQAQANQVSLKLDLRIPPECDRFIADPHRLRQILLNLLSNAVKFTPSGGEIILRVVVNDQEALFEVQDTGIGIPEHQQALLFEKFQQLDASYSRQYSGTGLGLALTKSLVELHGGSIHFQSAVGVGSTFTVKIPMPSAQMLQGQNGGRVLGMMEALPGQVILIENQEESADLICNMLTAADYQMVWLTEGSAALEHIAVLQPVAIIINVQVPDTDGYDLIRRLRQNPAAKHLKVIAISQSNETGDREQCFSAGADDYLVKPIKPGVLLAMVNALVRQAS